MKNKIPVTCWYYRKVLKDDSVVFEYSHFSIGHTWNEKPIDRFKGQHSNKIWQKSFNYLITTTFPHKII